MSERLDLLIVNPGARAHVYGKLGSTLAAIEPPLWVALTASVCRQQGFSVKIVDAEAENLSPVDTAVKIIRYKPLLAYIIVLGANPSASSTPKMTAVGELLAELKKRNTGIKTMLGGLHPSALPERTLREEMADFVCEGEGFHTTTCLLELLKSGQALNSINVPGLWYRDKGKIISNPAAPLIKPDDLPMAAWDLLPMEQYRAHNWHCLTHLDKRQPYGIIYTSLGCPFNCNYCNIQALYNGKPGIRYRSAEKVVDEIGYLVKTYGIQNIKFLDELFALKEDRVNRICDMIIERGYDLNIWAYARVDTVSEKMLKKMKRAGINWLAYGFESGSTVVRRGVSKKFEQAAMKKAVRMTKDAGIYIIGNFIFGLPDDDLQTMQETLDMAIEFNLEYVNFYTAMAYPGSQLYEDALKQGIELPKSWHGYGQYSEDTLPLPTKYISAAEVLKFRDKAFHDYFNRPAYLEMIDRKFGTKVTEHIQDMMKNKILRKNKL